MVQSITETQKKDKQIEREREREREMLSLAHICFTEMMENFQKDKVNRVY